MAHGIQARRCTSTVGMHIRFSRTHTMAKIIKFIYKKVIQSHVNSTLCGKK